MKVVKDGPLFIHVEQILGASERAARLTRSLLKFSRKQDSNKKAVNLNEIVDRGGELLNMVLKGVGEIRYNLADEELMVMADGGQIEQVVMNLASNARDAMPDGGVLMITTSMTDIDLKFIKTHGFGIPGRYALLSVSDTGTGMSEQTREKIFEPFFTTKEIGKGTGLGLSISYGIIRKHEGHIICQSEVGVGTTFSIYLPLIGQIPKPMDTVPLPHAPLKTYCFGGRCLSE
jgi:signal transduction histidine kinase